MSNNNTSSTMSLRPHEVIKKRLDSAWIGLLLGLLVYGLYAALFSESWPINWLNLAQQSIFGAYSLKASLLLYILAATLIAALMWAGLERVVARHQGVVDSDTRGRVVVPQARGQVVSQAGIWLQVGGGFLAVLWLAGFASFAWFDRQQREDNSAQYRELRLEAAADVIAGEHRAVQGWLLANRSLTKKSGSTASARVEYSLFALVAENWRPNEAARLVIKVDQLRQLPGYSESLVIGPWRLTEPLLVRVGGALPLTATSAFEKIGVRIAPDHHVLHIVASRDGKPIQNATDYFQYMLWGCGIGSALIVILFAYAVWIARRRERGH